MVQMIQRGGMTEMIADIVPSVFTRRYVFSQITLQIRLQQASVVGRYPGPACLTEWMVNVKGALAEYSPDIIKT